MITGLLNNVDILLDSQICIPEFSSFPIVCNFCDKKYSVGRLLVIGSKHYCKTFMSYNLVAGLAALLTDWYLLALENAIFSLHLSHYKETWGPLLQCSSEINTTQQLMNSYERLECLKRDYTFSWWEKYCMHIVMKHSFLLIKSCPLISSAPPLQGLERASSKLWYVSY